jgi:hypothetical protein
MGDFDMNDEKNEGIIVREKIAGWLVLLAVILWFNLFLAAKVVMEVVNRPANSRIIYPALYVDIAIGCGCIWLLRLLHKRDLRFPGHYAAYNLLIYASWTVVIILAGIGAHMQWVAVGLQNLFLTPYVFRSKRVERTFPSLSSPLGAWERLRDRARRWGPVGLWVAMLGLLLLILALAVFLSAVV